MSFWNLSDGSKVKEDTSYAMPEGGDLFPNNTICTAYIEEVKWSKGFETELEYINVRWRIIAPSAYENRVHFQKLWVNGDNPAKDEKKAQAEGDRAKAFLGVINHNTGGGLPDTIPTDEDLQKNLLQKPMNIQFSLWKFTPPGQSEEKTGNNIKAISPKSAVHNPPAATVKVAQITAEEIGDILPF